MVIYQIYTENGRYKASATNALSAWFKAFTLGCRSYLDRDPQRVVVEKWFAARWVMELQKHK